MNKIEDGNLSNRGRGRPKGAQNKVTREAKQAIAEAAEMLGGVNRLAEWAQEAPENERAFWSSIYPKLLPVQIAGDADNPLQMVGKIELIGVRPNSGA